MIALLLMLAAAPAEQVVSSGGELSGPPAQTTSLEGDEIAAYGFTEVPARSRLQAAYAISDANARAEIVKLVRVRVTDLLKADSTATKEQIESRTTEVARGLLPAIPPAQRGWRKLRRGNELVLQVWSRLVVAKARLEVKP